MTRIYSAAPSPLNAARKAPVLPSAKEHRSVFSSPLPHLADRQQRYSLTRAIRQMCDSAHYGTLSGVELETSNEIASRCGRDPQPGAFYVPLDCLLPTHRRAQVLERRDITTATGAGTIAVLLGETLDILRPACALGQLGATILPDLVGGQYALPVKGSAVSLGWLPEGVNAASTNPIITQQSMFTPNVVGAYVDISYLALRSAPTLEEQTKADLLRSVAVELDRVAITGTGNAATNEPLGMLQDVSIPQLYAGSNGGAPTLALLCQMESTIANANGDLGRMGFLTSPNGRSILRRTFENGTGSRPLWRHDGTVLGYPARTTTLTPNDITEGSGTDLTAFVMGSWDDLYIGLWGYAELLVNPYQLSSTGYVRVTMFMAADIRTPRKGAFCKVTDVNPS